MRRTAVRLNFIPPPLLSSLLRASGSYMCFNHTINHALTVSTGWSPRPLTGKRAPNAFYASQDNLSWSSLFYDLDIIASRPSWTVWIHVSKLNNKHGDTALILSSFAFSVILIHSTTKIYLAVLLTRDEGDYCIHWNTAKHLEWPLE